MKLYSQRENNTDVHILEFNPTKENLIVTCAGNEKRSVLSKIKHGYFQARGYKLIAKWNWSLFNYRPNNKADVCGLYYRDKGFKVKDTTRNDVMAECIWMANKLYTDDIVIADIANKYPTADWATSVCYTLVENGKISIRKSEHVSHAKNPNPRTMLGQKKNGTVIVAVTDGRTGSDRGLTAKEQATLMHKLGCNIAVNVDGGGSSELMVRNENNTNLDIINSLVGGERAIANAILVYGKKVTIERVKNTSPAMKTKSQLLKEKYIEYVKLYPELSKSKHNLMMCEGLGAYTGDAACKSGDAHKNGRMGAMFATITNQTNLHYTNYASTLPDIPMGNGKYNTGTPTPTLKTGVYKVYSTMHLGKYKAMELGLRNEGVPVVRRSGSPLSSGINIHYRTENDANTYASSAGCLTILNSSLPRFLEYVGVTKNGKYQGSGRFIGYIIVDRSFISDDLQTLYRSIYGNKYDEVFNTNTDIDKSKVENPVEKPTTPIVDWKTRGFNSFVSKGIIESPDYWSSQLNDPMSVGEYFGITDKVYNQLYTNMYNKLYLELSKKFQEK